MNFWRERRGQFEILGIAIFIVIAIIGFIIFAALPSTDKNDSTASFENEQLSQTLVDSMLRTQLGPDCPNQPDATLYDLLRDITIVKRGICTGDSNADDAIFKTAALAIIKGTTGSRYDFTVSVLDDPTATPTVLPSVTSTNCPTGRGVNRDRTGEERIPLLPSTKIALVELQLCGGRL